MDAITTDVLVIGAGNAGLRASIEARRYPVEVTLVAKGLVPGGASTYCAQNMWVLPPGDDIAGFCREMTAQGRYLNDQALVEVYAKESYSRAVELEDYGLLWDRDSEGNFRFGKIAGSAKDRMLTVRGLGANVTNALLSEARRLGVIFKPETIVASLLLSDGAVAGALALDIRRGEILLFRAKSVILATGGCAQIYGRNSAPRGATGDGCSMALRAGARLVNMEFQLFVPQAILSPPAPPEFDGMTLGEAKGFGDVLFLNALGERYMQRYDSTWLEHSPKDVLAIATFKEIKAGRGGKYGGVIMDPTRNSPKAARQYCKGSPKMYERIKAAYGERAADWLEPFEASPSALSTTGSIDIDVNGQTCVPGLYAAGEVGWGGLHGANRIGSAAAPTCLVFGKRAGESAAKRALKISHPSLDESDIQDEYRRITLPLERHEGISATKLKKELRSTMWDYVGVIRTGDGLQEALLRLHRLRKDIPEMCLANKSLCYNQEWVEAIEVDHMIECAEMVTRSALFRRESRGSHYREDCPAGDPGWLIHSVLQLKGGETGMSKRALT